MLTVSSTELNTILLVARVVVGVTIFVHGYNKMFRGGKIKGTANWFEGMGMKPNGLFHAYLASLTEMTTGVLLIVGLFVPLAAAGVIGIMVVAAFTDHRGNFLMFKNGWEYVLVLGTLSAVVGGLGGGAWSLDHLIGLTDTLQQGWRGLAITLGLGLGTGILTLALFHRPPEPATKES